MLLDELRQKKHLIDALANKFGARRVRVFGSVARREERPDSDVDFLVDLPRGYDLLTQRLPLPKAWRIFCIGVWSWCRNMNSTGISVSK